jgi:hypothetical protein
MEIRGSCPPTSRQLQTIPPVHGSKSDEQDQQTRLQVFHCPPAARLSAEAFGQAMDAGILESQPLSED